MKVLIFTNASSGLYRFRGELLTAMAGRGYRVTAALPDGLFIEKLTDLGCRCIETPFNRRGLNPLSDLRLFFRYLKILGEARPDAALTYTVKPNVYGGLACRLKGVPYISNVTGLGAAIERGGPLRAVTLGLYKAGLKKAFRVFFQNRDNMDFMCRRIGSLSERARLLPGSGVNTGRFTPGAYPGRETIRFLFVGRMMEEKGIGHYLEAAEHFHRAGAPVQFHIAGDCEKEYARRISDMEGRGIVTWHGVCDDMRRLYLSAHCTVHPSYWEGMSNVLLESAACARPALASDIPGCREIVEDGVTGLLFKPGSTRALIEAISDFLAMDHEDRAQMGLAGRRRVEAAFDRQTVVDAYMSALSAVAGYPAPEAAATPAGAGS